MQSKTQQPYIFSQSLNYPTIIHETECIAIIHILLSIQQKELILNADHLIIFSDNKNILAMINKSFIPKYQILKEKIDKIYYLCNNIIIKINVKK